MNFSGYVWRHATIFSWMFTTACCLVVWLVLGLGLGLHLVSGWLVVMHTYLYNFRSSLSHCPQLGWGAGARAEKVAAGTKARYSSAPLTTCAICSHSSSRWCRCWTQTDSWNSTTNGWHAKCKWVSYTSSSRHALSDFLSAAILNRAFKSRFLVCVNFCMSFCYILHIPFSCFSF